MQQRRVGAFSGVARATVPTFPEPVKSASGVAKEDVGGAAAASPNKAAVVQAVIGGAVAKEDNSGGAAAALARARALYESDGLLPSPPRGPPPSGEPTAVEAHRDELPRPERGPSTPTVVRGGYPLSPAGAAGDPLGALLSLYAKDSPVKSASGPNTQPQHKQPVTEVVRSKPVRRRAEWGRCPAGHELEEQATDCDGWTCSACGRELATGAKVWSCEPCEYDLCGDCHNDVFRGFVGLWSLGDGEEQLAILPGGVLESGEDGEFKVIDAKTCSLATDGEVHHGEIVDGKLAWDDGDVWTKGSADAIPAAAVEVKSGK